MVDLHGSVSGIDAADNPLAAKELVFYQLARLAWLTAPMSVPCISQNRRRQLFGMHQYRQGNPTIRPIVADSNDPGMLRLVRINDRVEIVNPHSMS